MSITLNTKPYTFKNVMNGISNYTYAADGIAAGFSNLSARVSIDSKESRVQWKIKVPVISASADACACPGDVLRSTNVDIIVKFAPGATAAERDDVQKQIKDLVATTEFIGSLASLAQPTA